MEPTKSVKVMLVSASRLFREGMKQLLIGTPYKVEAEAPELEEALSKLRAARDTELIVIDFNAAQKESIEQIRLARGATPKAKLIVLADDVAIIKLTRALGNDVDGYLLKDASAHALIQVLNLTMLGERVFPSAVVQALIEGGGNIDGYAPSAAAVGLSEREIEILRFLVDGASNKAVANRLEIAEATVKVHMKAILRKIRRKNRTQAAIWAVEHGIEGRLAPPSADRPSPAEPRTPATGQPRSDEAGPRTLHAGQHN